MLNSYDFSHGANCMIKKLKFFLYETCLVVALQIASASEWRTDPAHANRKTK